MFETIDYLVFAAMFVAWLGCVVVVHMFVKGAFQTPVAPTPRSIDDINNDLQLAFGDIDDDSHFTFVLDEENPLVQVQSPEVDGMRRPMGGNEDPKA